MSANPILTRLYNEAVLQQAQAEREAGRLEAGEYEAIRLDCRVGILQSRQEFAAMQGGVPSMGVRGSRGIDTEPDIVVK